MKKITVICAAMFALSVCAFAADKGQQTAEEKRLSVGTVSVYDFGKVRLHAYNTGGCALGFCISC